MSFLDIHCPAGERSQTGTAVNIRYPKVNINNCGGIADAQHLLLSGDKGPFVIPIWNSNQGEVDTAKYVWDLIEASKIKILDLWPKTIEFWFIVKTGKNTSYGVIGSVFVAETQCKNFLASKNNSKLKPYPLTTDAFEGYKNGDEVDGVLIAPDQGNEEGYTVESKKTANDNNFTSFVTLTLSNSEIQNCKPINSWLTGVTLGNLSSVALDEDQASFFENMFKISMNLSDIPKLVFVFKRTDKVGLLFEGENYVAGDFLDAEQLEVSDIIIHENAGELQSAYSKELELLISADHQELLQGDFILHRGVQTVLFACPVLGLYTHGFDEEAVEPVVRFYIDSVFEFIDSGGRATLEERELFMKYEPSWRESRTNFITFKVI